MLRRLRTNYLILSLVGLVCAIIFVVVVVAAAVAMHWFKGLQVFNNIYDECIRLGYVVPLRQAFYSLCELKFASVGLYMNSVVLK